MKICFLSKMFPPGVGGSERYAHELANALGERGHGVDVYTQAVPGSDGRVHLHDNVTVERITRARRYLVTFETLYYSLQARRRVDLEAYDVIHGTLMPASTIALAPRLGCTTPIVVTSHGTSVDETLSHVPEIPTDYLKRYFFHPMNVVMDSIAGRIADHVVAISRDTHDRLVGTYRFAPETVSLVPHGVDTEWFAPREERHPAVTAGTPTLLFVGRLVSRKGADLAVECVANLGHEAELLVAGTGRHEQRLRELARERDVADRVEFLGFVPDEDLPMLYSSADTLLFPSRYEGFGLVFLEAMACGTPVVATPVGGVPDVVVDGENGVMVPPDAAAMAHRVDDLLAEPDRLMRMGVAARRRAAEMDWETVAADVESVYESLLA